MINSYSHLRSKLLLVSFILTLATLACGAASQLPAKPTATYFPISENVTLPTKVTNYEVVGSWHVRECAGEDCEIVGVIENVVVVCYQYQTVEGGRWCLHDAGWSNMRGMK